MTHSSTFPMFQPHALGTGLVALDVVVNVDSEQPPALLRGRHLRERPDHPHLPGLGFFPG